MAIRVDISFEEQIADLIDVIRRFQVAYVQLWHLALVNHFKRVSPRRTGRLAISWRFASTPDGRAARLIGEFYGYMPRVKYDGRQFEAEFRRFAAQNHDYIIQVALRHARMGG